MTRMKAAVMGVGILLMGTLLFASTSLNALQLPEGKLIAIGFSPTRRAPTGAHMEARLKFQKGQGKIELKFVSMEPAILFGGDISAFVLWAVTPDSGYENLGEIVVDRAECSSSQTFATTKKIVALMVTAEPMAVVTRPTDLVIFTSPSVDPSQAKSASFTFEQFRPTHEVKIALDSISGMQYKGAVPVVITQAHKAVDFAVKCGAADESPMAMKDAMTAMSQADHSYKGGGGKKIYTDYARQAIELASQAVRDAVRAQTAKAAANAEAKRQAEKAALEQRATSAETESDRVARLLREVEAQRTALAAESKQLASERDTIAAERDAVTAQRDTVAADRDRIAVERTLIEKQRDELAGRLHGALASVAETNETAKGVVVSLPGILFDLNKATLKPAAQLTIAKLAGVMMVFQDMNLSIEGYTDATGTDEINLKLSTERAKTVYDFLKTQGIAENRMKFQGFGSASPVVPNVSEENRAKNRRVEVVLTKS